MKPHFDPENDRLLKLIVKRKPDQSMRSDQAVAGSRRRL